jgi:hypothetical protein
MSLPNYPALEQTFHLVHLDHLRALTTAGLDLGSRVPGVMAAPVPNLTLWH